MRARAIDPHRLLHWLALGACALFAAHGVHAALRPIGSDFTVFYRAGEALRAGRDPGEVERYLYLPPFALALAPLTLLPYAWAAIAWQAASLCALAWSARTCARWCPREPGEPGGRPWLAWLPLLACLRLLDSNLANGQANLLVLALVVVSGDAWLAGRGPRAGALLGAAAALKVLPGLLLLVFLVRRSWSALGGALASLVACLLLPACVLGWSGNAASLARWWREQPLPYLHGGEALLAGGATLQGQSLTAVTYRLLGAAPGTSRGSAGPSAALVELAPETVAWIVRGLWLGALALLAASLVRSARRDAPGARLRELALGTGFALLLGPLVQKAHMCWLLVAYAVLLAGAPAGLPRGARAARWLLVVLSIAAIGLTPPALLGRELATRALMFGAVFAGLVCVLSALLIDVWCSRPPEGPPRPPAPDWRCGGPARG